MKLTIKLILVIVIVGGSLNLFSQEKFVGVKGGYVFSALNNNLSYSEYYQMKEANTFGMGFKYFSSKNAAILLELNYTEKGGGNFFDREKLAEPLSYDSLEYPFVLSTKCIDFNFLMHLSVGNEKNQLFFNAGPNISYTFYNKTEFIYPNIDITMFNTEIDNLYEFGLNFGVGYGRHFKTGAIEFEIRYSHGLTNIYESQSINYSIVTQNQLLTFSLAYYLKLKKKEHNVKNNES